MAKARWNTVQEYLDCTDAHRTKHAMRRVRPHHFSTPQGRAELQMRVSNGRLKRRLLEMQKRKPLDEDQKIILERIRLGYPGLDRTSRTARERLWNCPVRRQRHREACRIAAQKQGRPWHTVQEYLDCDDPYRTNQATRSWNQYRNPQYLAKQSSASRKRMQEPGVRAQIARSIRQLWQDPAYRARQIASRSSQRHWAQRWGNSEKKAAHSEKMRALWSDPQYRQRVQARMQQANRDPQKRQRSSETTRERWQDPTYRQRIQQRQRQRWQQRKRAQNNPD